MSLSDLRLEPVAEIRSCRTFILLSVQNAMRRGEQLRLRWQDIDLDRGVAHLRETKVGELAEYRAHTGGSCITPIGQRKVKRGSAEGATMVAA